MAYRAGPIAVIVIARNQHTPSTLHVARSSSRGTGLQRQLNYEGHVLGVPAFCRARDVIRASNLEVVVDDDDLVVGNGRLKIDKHRNTSACYERRT